MFYFMPSCCIQKFHARLVVWVTIWKILISDVYRINQNSKDVQYYAHYKALYFVYHLPDHWKTYVNFIFLHKQDKINDNLYCLTENKISPTE